MLYKFYVRSGLLSIIRVSRVILRITLELREVFLNEMKKNLDGETASFEIF